MSLTGHDRWLQIHFGRASFSEFRYVEMMMDRKDRRGWQRTTPEEKTSVVILVGEREIQGTIVDISHSGVFVKTNERLPVGTLVRLDLSWHDRGVQVEAVVARHAASEEPSGMALSLRRVRLEDRMSLDNLIERAAHSGED